MRHIQPVWDKKEEEGRDFDVGYFGIFFFQVTAAMLTCSRKELELWMRAPGKNLGPEMLL